MMYENGTSVASHFEAHGRDSIEGAGPHSTVLKRSSVYPLPGKPYSAAIAAFSVSGSVLRDISINVNRSELGDVGGHGYIADSAHRMRYSNLSITNFGTKTSDDNSGGTGFIILSCGEERSKFNHLYDSEFIADPTAGITIGWLFNDTDWSTADNIYVQDTIKGIGFAHELKTTSSYNILTRLGAKNANVALAYGGEQSGSDGCSYNIASDILASYTNIGFIQSKGRNNIVRSMIYDGLGAPGVSRRVAVAIGTTYTNGLNSTASENAAVDIMGAGTTDKVVELGGTKNYARVFAHAAGKLVEFVAGCSKGVVELLHVGNRASIFPDIVDNSGNPTRGPDANVVISPATGERRGSLSGTYHDKLEESGASFHSLHYFRSEALNNVIHAMGHNGAVNNVAGIQVSIPNDPHRAGFWHVIGATVDEDRWAVRGWGQSEVFGFTKAAFVPTRDATDSQARYKDLGSPTQRWRRAHAKEFRPGDGSPVWTSGTGSPEGVLAATVGSLYTRTDGGAGTTLYVKETGTGNTGWTAK